MLLANAVSQRRVFALIAAPPIDQPAVRNAVPGGVIFCMGGDVKTNTLLRFVALSACVPLAVPLMLVLAGMLLMGMDALPCARELDSVTALAIIVLGKVAGEELSTTRVTRARTKATATADVMSELLMQMNVDIVECVLDDGDVDGVHAYTRRALTAAGQDIGDPPIGAPPESGSAKPGDDVAFGSTKVALTGSRTLDAAWRDVPPAAGCTISLDTVRQIRWSVRYSRPTPPRTLSLAVGRGETTCTMETLLLACYR